MSFGELLTLARRAEVIRQAEIRRCRGLRDQPRAIALADEVSSRLVSALLDPLAEYLDTPGCSPDAGRRLCEVFGLHHDSEGTRC